MKGEIMKLIPLLMLILSWTNVSFSKRHKPLPQSCTLHPTPAVKQTEPTGEPLLISVDMKVLDIREVPDTGGSYGVELQ